MLGDKFAAVGTGAEIAMGVLESEYRDGLSVEEGRPLILRAIKSAVARDISSGDGVDLLIITHKGRIPKVRLNTILAGKFCYRVTHPSGL